MAPIACKVGMSARSVEPGLGHLGAELDRIEALGVDLIELPTFDYDLVVGGRIRRPQLAALIRACEGRSVAYSVHGPLAINLMDPAIRSPRHMEVLEASLDVAAAVGAEHYVVHAGMTKERRMDAIEEGYGRQRDLLAAAGDLAAARGLVLCVETLFEFDGFTHTPSPARLARELAAIGHPAVKATIDVSHSYLKLDAEGRRDSLVEEIGTLAPFAPHFHLHDSFGRPDDLWMYTEGERLAYGHGDLHLPIGWGDIPWDAIVETCVFPEGAVFNIELNPRYLHASAECVAAARDLARRARTAPASGAETLGAVAA
ncbi:hypothetical protein ASG54_12405 [Aureimonas sp. Leaf460]|nr:hypothetical protein ASG62_08540 [Aureimonas sp. Leaf427]KQT77049.1 hypothetical protein ASG54_12405 [Aureimonas sp. Leaf460]